MMQVIRAAALIGAVCGALCAAEQSVTKRGIEAFKKGNYAYAERALEQAAAADANDFYARTFLALARAAMGRCSEADGTLSELLNTGPTELRKLAGIGAVQCLLAEKRSEDAVVLAVELEKRFPGDADVLYEAARAQMKGFDETTRAMFMKTPSSYRVNELSAEIFETQEKFGEAASEYRNAIAKNGSAVGLHFRLGRVLLLGSHDAEALTNAKKEFEAELALSPNDAAAEFQIGQIAKAENNVEDATAHFERAVQLDPEFADAGVALARVRCDQKRYGDAISLLQHIVSLEPANEAAHYQLMLAYRNSGDLAAARKQQNTLNQLRSVPEGEFADFLKRLGDQPEKP